MKEIQHENLTNEKYAPAVRILLQDINEGSKYFFSHFEVKLMISADEVLYCLAKAKTDAIPIEHA